MALGYLMKPRASLTQLDLECLLPTRPDNLNSFPITMVCYVCQGLLTIYAQLTQGNITHKPVKSTPTVRLQW